MALQTAVVLLLAALSCNSAFKLDKLKTHNTGGLTIFGGTPVEISEVPFVARLVYDDIDLYCGAAIINEKFLLTTANCADSGLSVVVGSDKLGSGDKYEIDQIYSHPYYCPDKHNPDIAVIELAKNLTFGQTVQPIALAEPDMEFEDDAILEAYGFGLTEDYEESYELLKVELPYVPADECEKAYSELEVEITDDMMCAGGIDAKDTCRGDEGGPLVYKDRLVGLTSYGYTCAEKGSPGTYARISALRSFIDDIVN